MWHSFWNTSLETEEHVPFFCYSIWLNLENYSNDNFACTFQGIQNVLLLPIWNSKEYWENGIDYLSQSFPCLAFKNSMRTEDNPVLLLSCFHFLHEWSPFSFKCHRNKKVLTAYFTSPKSNMCRKMYVPSLKDFAYMQGGQEHSFA